MDLGDFARGGDAATAGDELSRAIAGRHVRRSKGAIARALRASVDELLTVTRTTPDADRLGPAAEPFDGVFGAGVIEQPDGVRPFVCVDPRLAPTASPRERLPGLADLPDLAALLADDLGAKPREDTVVLALPPPRPQYGPGRVGKGPGRTGTLGALVTTATGKKGILTAGHVAPAGAVIRNGDGSLAEVELSIDPAQTPAAQVVPDVAVLVPHVEGAWHPGVALHGTRAVQAGEMVTLTGVASGTSTGRVVGAMPAYWVSASSGLWASVYLTDAGISLDGDSGGPVTPEGSSELVGHLVGASGSVTSFIQSIDVQLTATGAVLRS